MSTPPDSQALAMVGKGEDSWGCLDGRGGAPPLQSGQLDMLGKGGEGPPP